MLGTVRYVEEEYAEDRWAPKSGKSGKSGMVSIGGMNRVEDEPDALLFTVEMDPTVRTEPVGERVCERSGIAAALSSTSL